MITYNSYKFRIYPTPEQEEQMFRTIGCTRKVYNLILYSYQEVYDKYEKGKITKKEYTERRKSINPSVFKGEYEYLSEVDSTALKYAKKHCDSAYSNFFKGNAQFPQFKKRNVSKFAYTTCRASKKTKNLRLEKSGKLTLPKVKGAVKTVVTQNPKGTLVSATITKERTGRWYVSMKYEQHITAPKITLIPENPIGLDMGIKDLAVSSAGDIYQGIKSSYVYKEEIAQLDKTMSRQKIRAKKDGKKLRECSNYQKNKVKRAKLHAKVKNIRMDTLHKITSLLVNHHDFIGLESLSSSNMVKNHNLAFAISDASWCEFKTMLQYKSKKQGKIVFLIDRFFASTQQCSECLEKTGPKGMSELHIREWVCSNCEVIHDRDINAAVNILHHSLHDYFVSEITAGTAGEEDLKLLQSSVNKLGIPNCSQEKSLQKTFQ